MRTDDGNRPPTADGTAQLGGVRADFVANLGRRLAEVRRHWTALESDPGSPRARDEVRRRIHALAVRARVVGLTAMADRLDQAEHSLERAAAVGGIDHDDVKLFHALFEDLPALAWHEVAAPPAPRQPAAQPPQAVPPVAGPLAVLVLGDQTLLASVGSADHADRLTAFECEQTVDLSSAPSLARALAPDVILLDTDQPGSLALVDAIAQDPLIAAVPIVAIGSWERPDQAAPWISRGVAQCLARPVTPARIRAALTGASRIPRPVDTVVHPLDGTVVEIADRLADQVRRGLVDALEPRSHGVHVDLGDGTEVLAAIWGAVARIREIVRARTEGAVSFTDDGPVGAIPLAPWLDLGTDPMLPRRSTAAREPLDAPVRLDRTRILVADDDPAVTWFFADLFRTAGAAVREARDGRQALEAAIQEQPDLVVTDILMPHMDGFALTRALKNDVVLRDVPVVMLSWKEDLLQRVRDLGASADGYLRKEASAAAVLRKVHELLRPRLRLEDRLRSPGEVRGRLDGWSALSLLRIVTRARPDCTLSVRDANHLYELGVKDGQIVAASRTAFDGSTVHGAEALASLPGVSSGRFQVGPGPAIEGAMPLDQALITHVVRARAACSLVTGPAFDAIRQVRLVSGELFLDATPEPARTWLQAMIDGMAPRSLPEAHGAPRGVVERLLVDAGMRGAIAQVLADDGADLLGRAVADALGGDKPEPWTVSDRLVGETTVEPSPQVDRRPALFSDPPPNPLDAAVGGQAPTSLAEAVIREVADAYGSLPPPSGAAPFLVDINELRPRTSPPGPLASGSLPPDAMVPEAEGSEVENVAAEPAIPSTPSVPPCPQTSTDQATQPSPPRATPPDRFPEPAASHEPSADSPAPRKPREQRDLADEPPDEPVAISGQGPVARWWPTALLLLVVVAAVVTIAKLATHDTSAPLPPVALPSSRAVGPDEQPPAGRRAPAVEADLALPEDLSIDQDQSVIEVRPGSDVAVVYVDGTAAGSGDVVRSVVTPGEHEVVVRRARDELRVNVATLARRRTRVSMEGLWTR